MVKDGTEKGKVGVAKDRHFSHSWIISSCHDENCKTNIHIAKM